MLLTAHQPNYLPYLGFFEKIANADMFLIVDNVQFVKRGPYGWIHRNKIRNANGWQWLSLDCLTKGKYTQNINDVILKPGSSHLRKHWRAIEVNYKRAAHFDAYHEDFKKIYMDQNWEMLSDLSSELILATMKALEIDTPVNFTSRLGVTGVASELIINMCQEVGAKRYLSGMHGKDYVDFDLFDKAQIKLEFQDYHHPTYAQCWLGDFQPYMCALDLIFNHGPSAKEIMMSSSKNAI